MQEQILECNQLSDLTINDLKLNISIIGENKFYGMTVYSFDLKDGAFEDEIEIDCKFLLSKCSRFIFAYDSVNGNSYRLKGFNGNDLLFLIRDIKKKSYDYTTDKNLVDTLFPLIEELDLNCIYKSLKRQKWDMPCLKVCKEGVAAH